MAGRFQLTKSFNIFPAVATVCYTCHHLVGSFHHARFTTTSCIVLSIERALNSSFSLTNFNSYRLCAQANSLPEIQPGHDQEVCSIVDLKPTTSSCKQNLDHSHSLRHARRMARSTNPHKIYCQKASSVCLRRYCAPYSTANSQNHCH